MYPVFPPELTSTVPEYADPPTRLIVEGTEEKIMHLFIYIIHRTAYTMHN